MDNISISSPTSLISSSDGYQGHCINISKEDSRIAQNINISSATICFLILLIGTIANGYVIWLKVFRLEKTFRSVLSLNIYISGFAWSIFLLLNIVYFARGDNWPFGSFVCQLNKFVFHFYMFIHAFILTLYSIDYFLVVIYPFQYNYYRKPKLASVESLVSCCIAFAISVLNLQKPIGMATFFIGYCIPLLIMLLSFIITAVVYHWKKTSKYSPSSKLIFTFQVLFGVFWLPYHVFSLIQLSLPISGGKNLEGIAEMVQPITISVASLSCCVNPIIFLLTSPDLKKDNVL